ncbi:MAG: hypothetical protein KatS3mg065_0366 [Chloroflexota bacterium]|nr:MAG: hypothetical protein KatS3mg065_0366 [Chloroflexota bacterium]
MTTGTVIYLDVDDEITSAATRIRAAEANRLALVVPPGSRIATSRMNFRLLAREAGRLGRRLAVVAPDAPSRALAAAAGLEVFATVGEYEASLGLGGGAGPGSSAAPEGAAAEPRSGTGLNAEGEAGPGPGAPGPGGGARSARPGEGGLEPTRVLSPAGGPGDGTTGVEGVGGAAALPVAAGLPAARVRRSGRRRRFVAVGVGLLALVLAVGGVAGSILLPTATVRVVPRIDPVGPLELTVVADPETAVVDADAARIPATRVAIPVQVEDRFPATGKRVVEAKASGTVVFTSRNTGAEVEIPAGTQVSTASGIVFRTTRRVVVPKATFLPPTPGLAEVPVEALEPGPAGNVPAGAITRVSTVIQARLVNPDDPVSNPEPTKGGKRDEFPQVTKADVDRALAALTERAETALRDGLADPNLVPAGLTVFEATASLGELTPSVDPASLVGIEATEFDLGLSGEGSVLAVDEVPISEIAEARVRGSVAPDHVLLDGSIRVEVGEPVVEGTEIRFPVTASGRQTVVADAAALREAIKGLPVEEARRLLEAYGRVTIEVWPDWVTRIPTLDWRLEVLVGPEAGRGRGQAGSGRQAADAGRAGDPAGAASRAIRWPA